MTPCLSSFTRVLKSMNYSDYDELNSRIPDIFVIPDIFEYCINKWLSMKQSIVSIKQMPCSEN